MEEFLARTISELTEIRDRLQVEYEKLAVIAEEARRKCVPVQQRLSKIQDALNDLHNAQQWNCEEVPL